MEASICWGERKKLGTTTGSDLSRAVKEQPLAACGCTELQGSCRCGISLAVTAVNGIQAVSVIDFNQYSVVLNTWFSHLASQSMGHPICFTVIPHVFVEHFILQKFQHNLVKLSARSGTCARIKGKINDVSFNTEETQEL